MKLSLTDLVNNGSYWSTIALQESNIGIVDACKLRPFPPPGELKFSMSKKKPDLSRLDAHKLWGRRFRYYGK